MNKNQNTTICSELEALQRKVARLEKRIARLEKERDEAREWLVISRISTIRQRNSFYHRFGYDLPSESIRLIRLGQMTLEQAIADRNARYPIFTYSEPGGLTLAQACTEAV